VKYEEEQLQLILQSIQDAKTVQEPKKSVGKIKTAFLLWACIYTAYNVLIYFMQQLNLKNQWYLQESYFLKYGLMMTILNLLMICILYVFIKKSTMPLCERRFLLVWIIFPVLICINNVIPFISTISHTEFLIQYYRAFPFSLVMNALSILFTYSYSRSQSIFRFMLLNAGYCLLAFLVLASMNWNLEPSLNHVKLVTLVDFINSYGIIEILSMLFLFANLKEEKDK